MLIILVQFYNLSLSMFFTVICCDIYFFLLLFVTEADRHRVVVINARCRLQALVSCFVCVFAFCLIFTTLFHVCKISFLLIIQLSYLFEFII